MAEVPTKGSEEMCFSALQLGAAVWSFGLLVVGNRAVHGWSWLRSLASLAAAVALLAAIVGVFAMI